MNEMIDAEKNTKRGKVIRVLVYEGPIWWLSDTIALRRVTPATPVEAMGAHGVVEAYCSEIMVAP